MYAHTFGRRGNPAQSTVRVAGRERVRVTSLQGCCSLSGDGFGGGKRRSMRAPCPPRGASNDRSRTEAEEDAASSELSLFSTCVGALPSHRYGLAMSAAGGEEPPLDQKVVAWLAEQG